MHRHFSAWRLGMHKKSTVMIYLQTEKNPLDMLPFFVHNLYTDFCSLMTTFLIDKVKKEIPHASGGFLSSFQPNKSELVSWCVCVYMVHAAMPDFNSV